MKKQTQEVSVDVGGGLRASAILRVPAGSIGCVLFAHGSGSSRLSPRNAFVADALAERGFASLLLDLLMPREEETDRETGEFRFDIGLLAERFVAATHWARAQPSLREFSLGYFGASTGAAAALVAAAKLREYVRAVVSRGGRPDLAASSLLAVTAPTLLIVGGADDAILGLNRRAAMAMTAPHEVSVVPNATHLFEERGALRRSRAWHALGLSVTFRSQLANLALACGRAAKQWELR